MDHLRSWRSNNERALRVEMFPMPGCPGRHDSGLYIPAAAPQVVVDFNMLAVDGRSIVTRDVRVLTVPEMLELAAALREVAEAAEDDAVARADALGIEAWW